MDTSAFTKVHRFKNVRRLCVFLVMSCVLVLGGVSLLAPIPAQATCGINLFPPATEGQSYSVLVTSTSTGAGFTCTVVAFDTVYSDPLPFPWSFDPNTAMFRCNPPIGSAGQYTLCFQCQEYDQNTQCYPSGGCGGPCWPAGNTQCQKCTTLTILSATTGTIPPVIIYTPSPTPTPTVTTFNYTIGIESGLTSSTAPVAVNGTNVANLAGGENRNFEGTKGNNYTVSVPNTIEGNSGTRFVIQGTAVKTVNLENPNASFNYTAEYYVEFKTNPINVAQLPGSNWYPKGTQVNSSAPELVKSEGENKEYTFAQWNLAGGGTSLSRDLALTVNNSGSYIAAYNSRPIATSTQGNTLLWIIILVIVVVAAGIAIAILARRRGSKSE